MTRVTPEETTLLSPAALAAYLDVPVSTCYAWNYHGTGPKVLHVGRHVRYRRSDVETWLDTKALVEVTKDVADRNA
jgi:excisionase family DNA binding protein